VEEIIRQLDKRLRNIKQPMNGFDIKLANGILRNGKFIAVDSVEFTPFYIDIEYNEDAAPVKEVDDYLTHLSGGDEGYKKLILQMLAHPFITNADVKRAIAKFFFLIGDGNNGKGTMLEVIRRIIGKEYCSGNSIEQISDERYFVGLRDKLVNLGDDVEDKPIDTKMMKNLKNISTCDYVATRELFKNSKDMVLTTSMIFTTNHALKSFEKGEAYQRRVVWCPMYANPPKKDPRFLSKLTNPAALEYWMKLIVETYEELYETANIEIPKVVADHNKEYHEDNNNTLTFVNDYSSDYFIGKRPPEIYAEYEVWAEENGLTVHSPKMLKTSVETVHYLEVKAKLINKKTAKVYTKSDK
jgi:putative DNA primase/helicase